MASLTSAGAQDAYLKNIYQDANYLQRGLFETPLPGMSPRAARTKSDVEEFIEHFHFSMTGGVRYDSNIYLTHTDEVSDVIFSVSPTFEYHSGEPGTAQNTVVITYTPSFNVYAEQLGSEYLGSQSVVSFWKRNAKE